MTNHATDQRARPRKQPSQARARHTVDAIVEAAARILEEHGYGGFNTNAVAERAGVSIGTLYQYFPDKDALLGALIGRETARLLAEVESAASASSGREALDAVIRAAVGHQVRRPRLARLLDFEESRLPLDAETQAVRARFSDILGGILDRADMPRQEDLTVVTADVAAILRGMVDTAGERGETDQHALAQRVRRAVLGYLTMPSAG
ncbi:TetR/AcrR family transcriptional regulator [Citromicrobium bathyomarinum]